MSGLNDLYSSPSVIQVIKMRFSGQVPSIGKWVDAYRVGGGDLRETDHLVDRVIDGRIILRWNLRN